MSTFKNGDAELYFEVHGKGDPLLIIPGGGADGRFYLPIVEILKNHFKVILPDPRGCGRSEKGHQTYNFDLLASDMAALLDHLKIKSTQVMGHSMGGMVAQHFTSRYPRFVTKLILFATSPSLSAFGRHCCKTAVLAKTEASLKAFIYTMSIWNFSNSFFKNEENLNNLLVGAEQDPYPLQAESLIQQMKIIEKFDGSNQLKNIEIPTLIIGCEKDIIFPVSNVKKLIPLIQKSEYQEIPDAAHSVHIEHPELVAKMMEQFLRD